MRKIKTEKIYCGIKGLIPPPHHIFFNASCKKHDEGYAKGGDSLRRLECDVKFYGAMIEDIQGVRGYWRRLYYRLWAFLYFVSVRIFGWIRFKKK